MATVFKRGDTWVVKWKNATGRWVYERTECATKAEAKGYARDLEHRADMQRNGLAPVDSGPVMTFGELLDWYDEHHAHRLRSNALRLSVEKHFRPKLGTLPLVEVTSAVLEELLAEKVRQPTAEKPGPRALSPETINHLRAFAHRLFNLATRGGLWNRPNPVAGVTRMKVPKRPPTWLRPEEVRAVIPQVPERWRALFATAVYTAMRRGELIALHKRDVDLDSEKPSITVCRSWEADSTKSGDVRVVPVHPELAPFLRDAINRSPSELVFPRPDGSMHTEHIDLASVLRNAMARAGLVTGWVHKCRKCGHLESHADDSPRRCPNGCMKLWPSAVKRKERFHDLRHTTATLLLKAGTPLGVVQRLCGHSDPAITTEIYGHLEAEDARAHLERLSFAPRPTEPLTEVIPLAANDEIDRHGAPVVRISAKEKHKGPDSHRFPEKNQGLQMVGATGFEPATTCTPRLIAALPPAPLASTASAEVHISRGSVGDRSAPSSTPSTDSTQTTRRGAPVVRILGLVGGPVLTVGEVAEVLKVSRATVYAMVERGELEHFRVTNSIRIPVAALDRLRGSR